MSQTHQAEEAVDFSGSQYRYLLDVLEGARSVEVSAEVRALADFLHRYVTSTVEFRQDIRDRRRQVHGQLELPLDWS
jgi:hypothetical protein